MQRPTWMTAESIRPAPVPARSWPGAFSPTFQNEKFWTTYCSSLFPLKRQIQHHKHRQRVTMAMAKTWNARRAMSGPPYHPRLRDTERTLTER